MEKKGRKILQVKNEVLCLKKLQPSSCQTLKALVAQKPMQHDVSKFQGDVARRDRFPREAAFRGKGEMHPPIDVAGGDGGGGCRPDQLLVSEPQLIIAANFLYQLKQENLQEDVVT